ncbi:hypothetical protein [Spartinivicinus poritis]|uniref:DUF1794 domain-containing protein n=1 Tax=Spartinivicinus poritis TaxID=2994640 RepID=A0ABT5UC64_9GAMM|nr:hypothetical protein [Spartinivicinus sp. A2-2]MDE1463970.1 hypothetical protein [Spartinivicinus sp. A2-2]
MDIHYQRHWRLLWVIGVKLSYCLLFWPGAGYADELMPNKGFVSALVGDWRGEALQTPIGQRPYNISFHWVSTQCISGVANNGVSRHTWTFCQNDKNQLVLTFLSDFAGNNTPIHFKVIKTNSEQLTFKANSHPFMEVTVSRYGDVRWINVVHYGKLHVRIMLKKIHVDQP